MVIRHAHSKHPVRQRGLALLDVMVAGMILSGALVAILGIASRAMSAQIRGQKNQDAAQILDLIAAQVLALGPVDYPGKQPLSGYADPPFEDFHYKISINSQSPGEPHEVRITVSWESGTTQQFVELATLMAPRLGEEPDPEREPTMPIDR